MKALVYEGVMNVSYKDYENPHGDIILKVISSGLCGTDLKAYLKGHPMFMPPTILGHECIAKIHAVNIGSSKFREGDIVAVAPYIECGSCDTCINGNPELCKNKSYLESGCFCEYISLSFFHAERALYKLGGSDDVYTLAEPLACVINGIEKLRMKKGNNLIIGGGPMGTLFSLLLKTHGNNSLILEKSDWRVNFLKNLNIDVKKSGEFISDKFFDNVIIAVNDPTLIKKYIPCVCDGGTVLLFAGFPSGSSLEIPSFDIHYREIDIKGSFGFAKKHFTQALSSIEDNKNMYEEIITDTYDLEDGKKAFEVFSSGKSMKIIIRM